MAVGCTHDHALRRSQDEVSGALLEAESRVAGAGGMCTEPRRRVYELLLEAGAPVKAYDLMEAYADDRTAKPPTVYRALEFLERQGLAHRIESLSAYVACRRGDGGHAAAFLICDCCGRTDEVEAPVSEALKQVAADRGYALQSVAIEAHGRCAACRA